jgi:cytochrome c biogenesis protein
VDTGPEVYYTGIQIGYDPGVSFIWLGCLIMIIGMFLSFYLSFKRVWVRLSTDSVEIGGRSHRGKASFEKEFARLKAMLG